MKRDSKLSGILHVLLHMADSTAPVTSETLSGVMQTNPAVIRRIMSGLRDRGYVHSGKGHGGGWRLACDLEKLTLADVWRAVGEPALIAMSNRTESPGCLVEQAVNHALDAACREAESLLIAKMEEVTLAALRQDFRRSLSASLTDPTKVSCHERHE